jgi:signal transduction histidine kinase
VFVIDAHLHSCLSPCAELEMHPAGLVEAAVGVGLDAIALCDHNSAENVGAAERAGARRGLEVIPGIEVATAEEVHLLALLPDAAAAERLQRRLYRALPGRNDERVLGQQVVVDEDGEVRGFNQRLLLGATSWDLARAIAEIRRDGGVVVAAHVDRECFGILGQLGLIPPGCDLDALELSPDGARADLGRARAGAQGGWPLLCSSDAHAPGQVGRAVSYALLERATAPELALALAGAEGRMLLGGGRPMEDLALHILDIVQNSVAAGASVVEIVVAEDPARDSLSIEVRDNGGGMDAQTARRALDPFFTTRRTRAVGLGLPLLAAAARATGGELELDSSPGRGTRVRATLGYRHPDRQPLGDLETTLLVLFAGHAELELRFRHAVAEHGYELDSRALGEELGAALASPPGLARLRELIREGEAELRRRRSALEDSLTLRV